MSDQNQAPGNPEEDIGVFVNNILMQMQAKFEQMSDTILQRIDEMGTRIDDLEKSIGDLMKQTQQLEQSKNNTKE
eukprot:CAMPEP_0168544444 /NCGR_PEP_ID=MMETSP0413-20121227/2424_1 /TAXON_ID=136452 /ORGANISM="Filamoeba nolandi, Strain NC-AS-23-1" /LENGTH=74 /DNA_ID=CAMNT_0008574467 /DNA_START=15 /DNA_END=239 /DNA_ORIENTATION=+